MNTRGGLEIKIKSPRGIIMDFLSKQTGKIVSKAVRLCVSSLISPYLPFH